MRTNKVWRPRPIDKIVILGLGMSCYDHVVLNHKNFPPRNQSSELWVINAGCKVFQHDVCFDMHTKEFLADYRRKEQKACAQGTKVDNPERTFQRREWMKHHDKPIVMAKADPDIPTSLTYPLRDIYERFNSLYFTCGPAYMMAAALACEVKELQLHGVDFHYGDGAAIENGQACTEYWIGRAVERGVKVGVSNTTTLLHMHKRQHGYLYGYHEPVQMEFPAGGGRGRLIGPDYADQS